MRAAAERIRLRLRRSAEDIVAIGEDLLAVKAALPHGAFGAWLAAEFEMGTSTASRFMQVAERFAGKFPKLGNMPTSAIFELAAPSTDARVVAAVETRAAAGEAVTLAEVKRLKAALQAAGAEVKAVKAGRNNQIESLEQVIDRQRGELESLRARLVALEGPAAAPLPTALP